MSTDTQSTLDIGSQIQKYQLKKFWSRYRINSSGLFKKE